jgi:hypothetical protein
MTTNRLQIADYDIETGKNVIRDMTDEELAQHEIDLARYTAEEKARVDKIAAREAILEKLGLTIDEATLLLG